ncbi:YbbR-like domain-containing protein [bacterium]|nr:MAG: YbbR-like domain-containing protein [bacterium]
MKRKRLHIVIVSAVFGVLVWISVSMSEQYQIAVSVPISIDNVPEGKSIRTPVPQALQLKLRGDGWRLASLLLGADMKMRFPLQALRSGKKAITFADVAERIADRPGVQLMDMVPDSVFVELDRTSHRKVAVVLDYTVSFREGYGQVGPATVTPESVTVTGAESLLRTIDSWSTVRGIFENLKAPVEADLPLAPSPIYLVSLSTSNVHLRIDVEPFAEKVFSGLPVEIRSVAPNREVILIPPKIEIVARGGIKQLSNASPSDFRLTVDYRMILADPTGIIDPDIIAPPEIQVVSRRPEHLQYVVRRRL